MTEQGGVETSILIPVELLAAQATLSEIGTGNRTMDWNRSTRTISASTEAADGTSIAYAMLI